MSPSADLLDSLLQLAIKVAAREDDIPERAFLLGGLDRARDEVRMFEAARERRAKEAGQ